MRTVLAAIVRFFRALLAGFRSIRSRRRRAEDLYTSASRDTRDELLASISRRGGFHRRQVHMLAPPASSDGVAFDEETFDYANADGVPTQVALRQAIRCDCGAVLAYGNNLIGTCSVCGATVCGREGCARRCERCGLVCARHAVTFGKHTFCTRHRLFAWWLLWWGMLK